MRSWCLLATTLFVAHSMLAHSPRAELPTPEATPKLLNIPSGHRLAEIPIRDAPSDCLANPVGVQVVWLFLDKQERLRRVVLIEQVRFHGFDRPGYVLISAEEEDYLNIQAAKRVGRLLLARPSEKDERGVSIKEALSSIEAASAQ